MKLLQLIELILFKSKNNFNFIKKITTKPQNGAVKNLGLSLKQTPLQQKEEIGILFFFFLKAGGRETLK